MSEFEEIVAPVREEFEQVGIGLEHAPERLCHLFKSDEFPKALCGFDLSGRIRHSLDECARLGHGRCAKCLATKADGGDTA